MEYTRSEVAKIIGVSASTIKNYDTWHLVHPKRDNNNYRIYSEDDLEKLREITIFRQLGLEVENDILPLMADGVYDREKILSFQISKLNEKKREIEKSIRLTTLIRLLGPDILSLKDPERSTKESIQQALDLLGNPAFDELFAQADALSDTDTEQLTEAYQSVLNQFQYLLKKRISPDDPYISGIIRILLDETISLTPSHLQKKIKKYYHAIMLYSLAKLSSDSYMKKGGPRRKAKLREYLADCFWNQYQTDWINDSENLLRPTLKELLTSTKDIALSDSLLAQWEQLMNNYFGPFNPTYLSAERYLSLPKKLMLDVYGDSETISSYIDRLYELISQYLSADKGVNS